MTTERRLRYRALAPAELPQFTLRAGECAVLWRGDGWWAWWCERVPGANEVAIHATLVIIDGYTATLPSIESVPGLPGTWRSVELGIRIDGVPAHAPWCT